MRFSDVIRVFRCGGIVVLLHVDPGVPSRPCVARGGAKPRPAKLSPQYWALGCSHWWRISSPRWPALHSKMSLKARAELQQACLVRLGVLISCNPAIKSRSSDGNCPVNIVRAQYQLEYLGVGCFLIRLISTCSLLRQCTSLHAFTTSSSVINRRISRGRLMLMSRPDACECTKSASSEDD